MSLAVVVIASEKRKNSTFPTVMNSVFDQLPDEMVSIGDFPMRTYGGWKHVVVGPMLRNTIDALVKRDVGWIATRSDNICYLSDDHTLAPDFVRVFRETYESRFWGQLAPSRFVMRDGQRLGLNVGRDLGYIGGHSGIYRRSCNPMLPWSSVQHHPNWDVLHSHQLKALGAELMYADEDLAVEDIEGGRPWE